MWNYDINFYFFTRVLMTERKSLLFGAGRFASEDPKSSHFSSYRRGASNPTPGSVFDDKIYSWYSVVISFS